MKKNVIISLADSKYFDLLTELVDSIQSFKESQNTAICILDAGLTEEQRKNLSSKVEEIKSADWDIKVPEFKVKGKEWLKSQVSRAFLTRYFPDYEKYLWIDADAWVNSWDPIELYFKGWENNKLSTKKNDNVFEIEFNEPVNTIFLLLKIIVKTWIHRIKDKFMIIYE